MINLFSIIEVIFEVSTTPRFNISRVMKRCVGNGGHK